MRLALGALAASVSLGCASQGVSLAGGYRSYSADDYNAVLDRWTRSSQSFSLRDTDDVLSATATYESYDFRWAYAERFARDYQLNTAERDTLRDRLLRESTEEHNFYVTLYGSQYRWTDLAKPTTAWIVRLVDDSGATTSPSVMEAVRRPGALERRYFPYTTVWRHVFRVRFPRISNDGRSPSVRPEAKWMALRFSGPEGRGELRWELQPTAVAAPTSSATP